MNGSHCERKRSGKQTRRILGFYKPLNHKGKRRSKKVGSKKAANAVKREVEARLAKGDMGMIKERCPTVGNYGKKWLDSSLQSWKDSTRDNYVGAFKHHIKPRLGKKWLDEIRRSDVKYLIEALRAADMSSARVQTVKNVLSGIFTSAVEDEIISVNPCARTGKYAGNSSESEIIPFTSKEVCTLLENAYKCLSFMLYTLFLLLIRTGLRIGEALALEWPDVDFENRKAEITKNYDYHRGNIVPPKNDKPRKVDLTHNAIEVLKRLRASMKVIDLSGAIFTDDKGQRLIYKPIYKAMRKAAPRPIRIHETFGILMRP